MRRMASTKLLLLLFVFACIVNLGGTRKKIKAKKIWSERDKRVVCLRGVDKTRMLCERIRNVCDYLVIKITCGSDKKQTFYLPSVHGQL